MVSYQVEIVKLVQSNSDMALSDSKKYCQNVFMHVGCTFLFLLLSCFLTILMKLTFAQISKLLQSTSLNIIIIKRIPPLRLNKDSPDDLDHG